MRFSKQIAMYSLEMYVKSTQKDHIKLKSQILWPIQTTPSKSPSGIMNLINQSKNLSSTIHHQKISLKMDMSIQAWSICIQLKQEEKHISEKNIIRHAINKKQNVKKHHFCSLNLQRNQSSCQIIKNKLKLKVNSNYLNDFKQYRENSCIKKSLKQTIQYLSHNNRNSTSFYEEYRIEKPSFLKAKTALTTPSEYLSINKLNITPNSLFQQYGLKKLNHAYTSQIIPEYQNVTTKQEKDRPRHKKVSKEIQTLILKQNKRKKASEIR